MAGDGSAAPAGARLRGTGAPARPPRSRSAARGEAEERGGGRAWREAFLRAPYLRDTFAAMGVLSETFETAITWERLPGFVEHGQGRRRGRRSAPRAA